MKIGFLFPGQGSQYVGMGKDLYEKYEEVRNIYDRVENLTGVDVKKISFEGPEEELNQTKNTQICILTMSLAILEILNKNGVKAEISAGLSLGEYSALIYSGILNFEDGVKLVQKRGEYMQNLVPDGEWLMSAILGMGENEVEEVCSKVQNGFAVPVNFNCPGQIVISGDKDGIKEAENIAKQYGARRVIELKTSGPFHTIKLQKASDELRKELDKIKFNNGNSKGSNKVVIPVDFSNYSLKACEFGFNFAKNIDAEVYTENDDMKDILAKHIISPVRFSKSLENMIKLGVDTFIEIGPGKTLSGFAKKIKTDKEIRIFNVTDVETLKNVLYQVLEKN